MGARRRRWWVVLVILSLSLGAQGTEAANVGVNQPAEDSAHTSGDEGIQVFAVRSDSNGTLASTNGDYTPFLVDGYGALKVIFGSRPTYIWNTPDAVGGASKLYADLFNASGSGKLVRVVGVYPNIKGDVAVTGILSLRFDLYRTSAVGTGGTAAAYKSATVDVAGGSISPHDTNSAALPAQITARHLLTGGATIAEWLYRGQCFVEETNAATYICSGQTNFLAEPGEASSSAQTGILLREGQGLLIKQGTVASLNNIAFRIVFTVE